MSNRYVSIADRFITEPLLQGFLHSRDLANANRILANIDKTILYIRIVIISSGIFE